MRVDGEGRSALVDGRYRYWLRRDWGAGPRLVVIGLNPSTADGKDDDPTIRVLRNVAKEEECGGLVMLNCYAHRTPSPDDLRLEIQRHEDVRTMGLEYPDPVGPRNDEFLRTFALSGLSVFLAAWGAGAPYGRQREVAAMFPRLRCLGVNRDGSPWHPLRKELHGLWPWSPALLP